MSEEHIGDRIRLRRMAVGLTQKQLGEAEGVDVLGRAVSAWETGESKPKPEKIPAIARALKIDADYLERGGYRPASPETMRRLRELVGEMAELIDGEVNLPASDGDDPDGLVGGGVPHLPVPPGPKRRRGGDGRQ